MTYSYRHICEKDLLSSEEKSVDRLAQYLGIDTTALTAEEIAHIVAVKIMYLETLKN